MQKIDERAFSKLFKDAFQQCFGHELNAALSETESKLMHNRILEQTGLVIGAKSIKNYSIDVAGEVAEKKANPSVSTLDTLARYVLKAPYTDEIARQEKEGYFPYWYKYREQFLKSEGNVALKEPAFRTLEDAPRHPPVLRSGFIAGLVMLFVFVVICVFFYLQKTEQPNFSENFHSISEDSLKAKGWILLSRNDVYWSRRAEKKDCLSLFTLQGDNWPDSTHKPLISNLLVKQINTDAFTAEVHLQNFVPFKNWQQAGLILMEDTLFVGKSLRLSLGYNDISGGYRRSPEILIQAVSSMGSDFHQPEEIIHQPVLYLDSLKGNPTLINNLNNVSFRIEKKGANIRLLYAHGSAESPAFREAVSRNFDIKPKYIGIFALEGFVDNEQYIPARFNFFSIVRQ